MPGANNSHLQILQTPDQVVLFTEMIHEARVVPLDVRPHLPPSIPQWHGDARGHWEGDTLVLESTNFSSKRFSFNIGMIRAVGSGETLHLTERFTRLGPDTLQYAYTVDDPVTFTRRFTAVQTMKASDGPLFEYACHEGNYAIPQRPLWCTRPGARPTEGRVWRGVMIVALAQSKSERRRLV